MSTIFCTVQFMCTIPGDVKICNLIGVGTLIQTVWVVSQTRPSLHVFSLNGLKGVVWLARLASQAHVCTHTHTLNTPKRAYTNLFLLQVLQHVGVHLLEKGSLAFKSPMLSEVGYLFSDIEEVSELVTFNDTNVGVTSTTAIL